MPPFRILLVVSRIFLIYFVIELFSFPFFCFSGLIDLHTHSVHSDGTDTQLSLIRAAHAANISVLAFTDHDQLVYDVAAINEAKKLNIQIIQGVEISTEWKIIDPNKTVTSLKCHLLGYFTHSGSSPLNDLLSSLRSRRHERNLAILDKLAAQEIFVEPREALAVKLNRSMKSFAESEVIQLDYVGRPHIARAMINKGYVSSMSEAFNKYLDDSLLALPEWSLDIQTACKEIHKHGGLAILAHPKTLKLSNQKLKYFLSELINDEKIPLSGLEAFSSRHSKSEASEFVKIAKELNLLVTGGSDYHGFNKQNVSLGIFGGGHFDWISEADERLKLLKKSRESFVSRDEFYFSIRNIFNHLVGYFLFGVAVLTIMNLTRTSSNYDGIKGKLQEILRNNFLVKFLFLPMINPTNNQNSSSSSSSSPHWFFDRFFVFGSRGHFLFCFFGLQFSYLLWGFLQERIMTKGYGKEQKKFVYSEFLVFSNRISAAVIAAAVIKMQEIREKKRKIDEVGHGSVDGGGDSFRLAGSATENLLGNSPDMKNNFSFFRVFRVCPPADSSLCSLSNVLSSWFQYESLHYVSFPLQVLSKSSKILFTMLMGTIINRSKYSIHEYFQALAITAGLLLFQISESAHHEEENKLLPQFAQYFGYLLLLLYMIADSFTATWQGKLFQQFPELNELILMLNVNVASTILTLTSLIVGQQFFAALQFLFSFPDCFFHCFLMSCSSASGQLFIFHTIAIFGPVSFASIMTLRQLFSLVLSLFAFSHSINLFGVIGLVLVFISLGAKIKKDLDKTKNKKVKARELPDFDSTDENFSLGEKPKISLPSIDAR